MANQARVEELSDSDPEETDISALANSAPAANTSLIEPADIPFQGGQSAPARSQAEAEKLEEERRRAHAARQAHERERTRRWQCLYPVYFDSTRTRDEGRRVSKELAVPNPLAREIVDAVQVLGLQIAFEPGKTHPKDWANPGRVRVLVKENGRSVSGNVHNKQHLYHKVAEYLKAHPTSEEAPLRLRIAGMAPQVKLPPPPAIPRGWKMGSILPLHSAAVSGGGVSENLFKDMMAEMQGESPAQGSGKAKKDKKIKQ